MLKKKILYIIAIGLSLLSFESVNANTIKNIEMDVFIDNLGTAIVTETWQATLTEGTEGYRAFSDLGTTSITDFTVTDEEGVIYESLPSWNSNNSFSAKKQKSGMIRKTNGIELCWGISNYGEKTYILQYKINNFVTQFSDYQGIYFNLLNIDQSVGHVTINITSEIPFSEQNSKIWSFGYNGTIHFINDVIVLETNYLSSYDYMVALVKFENDYFTTSKASSKTFDEIYEEAMIDVEEETQEIDSHFMVTTKRFLVISIIMSFLPTFLTLLVLFILLKKTVKRNNKKTHLDFGKEGKKLPSKIPYCREIPCNKDLFKAYWVAHQYNLVSSRTLKEGIIGVILLKWIKEGKITVTSSKKIIQIKESYAIDLSQNPFIASEMENKLFEILKEAAGSNQILEAKEFKKWSKKYYWKLSSWLNNIITKETLKLEQEGLINTVTTEENISKKIVTKKEVSSILKEEAIKLKGLEKFLLDFSTMPEREYKEVHLWEEYLIFANLLGIADKVESQFKKLYPEFANVSGMDTGVTLMVVSAIASCGYSGMQRGKSAASSGSSSDYSSGGGGSSYSSGGSSSGGSSGGGFR